MTKRVGSMIGLGLIGFKVCFGGIDDGVVAYYPFEGNADDASGKGNHGIGYEGLAHYDAPAIPLLPGAWPASGKRGRAAWFDGQSSIKLPQPTLLDGESNVTIIAWIWLNNASSPAGSGQILSTYDGFHRQQISTVLYSPGDIRFAQVQNGEPPSLIGWDGRESIQRIETGKWLMISIVLERTPIGSVFRLYVDTDLVLEARNPAFSRILYPNSSRALVGDGFKGVIDELRIYNRAVPRNEILELFYGGSDPGMKIEVANVRLCWFTPTNKTAQLQFRSMLTANEWTDLAVPVVGTGETTCITDPVDGPLRFYRVIYTP